MALFHSYVTKIDGRKVFVNATIYSAIPGSNNNGNNNNNKHATVDVVSDSPFVYNPAVHMKYADATGLWVTSHGIGGSMAVYEETIATDKIRNGDYASSDVDVDRRLCYPLPISAATNASFYQPQRDLPKPDRHSVQCYQGYKEEMDTHSSRDMFARRRTYLPRSPTHFEQHYQQYESLTPLPAGRGITSYFTHARL